MYRDKKIAHMAAYLIKRLGGRVDRLKLVKLMYLADRKSLGDRGYSISRDDFYAMNLGPVLSRTYDLMREEGTVNSTWNNLIRNIEGVNPTHSLREKDPKLGALSEYDRRVMNEVVETYGHMTSFELVRYVHDNCHEWKDPDGTSVRIKIGEILRQLGYNGKDAEYYESHAVELDAIESGAYGI